MSAYLTTLTGVTVMNESKNDNQSNFSKFNGNADKVKAGLINLMTRLTHLNLIMNNLKMTELNQSKHDTSNKFIKLSCDII